MGEIKGDSMWVRSKERVGVFRVGIRRWEAYKEKRGINTKERLWGNINRLIIALLDVEAMWLNCPKTLHPHFLPA